jgi:hypothetical protein
MSLHPGNYGNAENSQAIAYRLRREGHNIPSVDFASDFNGDATHILAADIHGNLVRIQISCIRWQRGLTLNVPDLVVH